MLHSVRKVFELAGIVPESVQFQKDEFDDTNIIDALIKDPKKCPVITTADFTNSFKDGTVMIHNHASRPFNPHAMVTAGALKGSEFIKFFWAKNSILANEWFIKCKNSYANDPDKQGKIQYQTVKF